MKFKYFLLLFLLPACERTEIPEAGSNGIKLDVICKGSGYLYDNYRENFSVTLYESEEEYLSGHPEAPCYPSSSYFPYFTITGLQPLPYWIRVFSAAAGSKGFTGGAYIEHNQNTGNHLTQPLIENSSTTIEVKTETVFVTSFQLEKIILNPVNLPCNDSTEWNIKFYKYHDPAYCCAETELLNEWNITGPSFPLSLPEVSQTMINFERWWYGPFYHLIIFSTNPDYYSGTIELDIVNMLKYSGVFRDSLIYTDLPGNIDITLKGSWTTY